MKYIRLSQEINQCGLNHLGRGGQQHFVRCLLCLHLNGCLRNIGILYRLAHGFNRIFEIPPVLAGPFQPLVVRSKIASGQFNLIVNLCQGLQSTLRSIAIKWLGYRRL